MTLVSLLFILPFSAGFFFQVAIMGTVIYTQWNKVQNLNLRNAAGILMSDPSKKIIINIPQHYRNSWQFSLGTDYYATECFTLRSGIGYDKTPIRKRFRDIRLPDSNRFAIALGGHYQATPTLGVDLGWTHIFTHKVRVHPVDQITGDMIVHTQGHVKGGADVYGAQVTWDII